MEGIKEVVIRAHAEDGIDDAGVRLGALTEPGFLTLHRLFIQRGRLETVWTVLRRFGYEDDLSLKPSLLRPTLELTRDSLVEISPHGFAFLTELFAKHDRVTKHSLYFLGSRWCLEVD